MGIEEGAVQIREFIHRWNGWKETLSQELTAKDTWFFLTKKVQN